MGKIVLDAELRAKLKAEKYGVELCAEDGTVVGYYVPRDQLSGPPGALPPPPTPEERAEAIRDYRENGGYTTAEVLAGLDEVKRRWESRP